MGQLFPGVKQVKKTPAQIAKENPSLWLGFLPVIGGAITTPLQLNEIGRATQWESAARHFIKLVAIKSVLSRGAGVNARGRAGQLSEAKFVPSPEPARIAEKLKARLAEQHRLRGSAVKRFTTQFQLTSRHRVPLVGAGRVLQLRTGAPAARFEGAVKLGSIINRKAPRQQRKAA